MAVELRKGQKVNLSKANDKPLGEILINLNWSQPPARKILGLTLPQQSIDLDLGCLYEMKDGHKGCVQALGNTFGSLKNFPFIALDGDDRSGAASDGENLRVNGAHIADFKRILIYTFIYEGVANWKSADGIVTVKCPGSEDLIVRMDEYSTSQRMCAIAMLENSNDQTFSIEKLIRFYDGHSMMDRAFGWGMTWTPGRKD